MAMSDLEKKLQALQEEVNRLKRVEVRVKELQEELNRLEAKERALLPKRFKRKRALGVLSPNPETLDLDQSFTWASTPQGEDYWFEVDEKLIKKQPLPDEARLQIQEWVITSYRQEFGE